MSFKLRALSTLAGVAVVVAASGPAKAEQVTPMCIIDNVATFKDRLHVKCTFTSALIKKKGEPPGKGLAPYYAVETNSVLAASVIHVALAALVHKRFLTVYYDENPDNNPSGCAKHDCRRLTALQIH